MKKLVLLVALMAGMLSNTKGAQGLSVETLAVIRSAGITDSTDYGAGVDLGLKLNAYVTGHVRAVAYSNDDWRGSAVDAGSLLVEAKLLTSANKKVTLSAIGGVTRYFGEEDWAFGVGPRVSVSLTKNLSLVGETQIEALFKGDKNLITSAGLQFSF